jgi:cytochrome P450
MVINMFIPLRWLPIKANQDFVQANLEIRRLLRNIIKDRRIDIAQRTESESMGGRDLLTWMIEQKSSAWTDEDILGHVSVVSSPLFSFSEND